MQHFSNRFCCIAHKNTHGSTVKFSRRMQCSNVALQAHKNVAPWPQGFILKLHFVNLNEIIKKKNKNNTSALLQEAILARNNELIRYRRRSRLRKCPDCNCKL